MGGASEQAERLSALGLNYSIPDKYLCNKHIAEPGIKKFIKGSATLGWCDYCDCDTDVVSLEALMVFIMKTVSKFYTDPGDFMPHDSSEGGYLWNLHDIEDILQGHLRLNIENESLESDVFDTIDLSKQWGNESDFWNDPADMLKYSWEYFKNVVEHRSRYYFAATKDLNSDDYKLMPEEILKEIGKNIKKYKLVKPLQSGTVFYRCRQHNKSDKSVKTVKGMTSPPTSFAVQPNRMSPAGISMFYGAFEAETAIKETVNFKSTTTKFYTTAIFKTKRELTIIDLSSLPEVPSPFDLKKRSDYYPLIFLNDFVSDLVKPLENKQLVHIDYVPTQIVTEYFRFPFSDKQQTHKRIDGIIYPSSRNGKRACVLFFDNEESLEVLDFDYSSISEQKIS